MSHSTCAPKCFVQKTPFECGDTVYSLCCYTCMLCIKGLCVLVAELGITIRNAVAEWQEILSSKPWFPTYGCIVVEQDVLRRKSPFPNDELIKRACYIVTIRLVIASSNNKVRVGVTIAVWDAANCVPSSEGSVDVNLQAIHFCPCEENVGPVRPWGKKGVK